MADLTPQTSWTAEDARHLARRAGFGVSPEAGAALAAANGGDLSATIDAWLDGNDPLAPASPIDRSVFLSALTGADPVTEPGQDASDTAGSVKVDPTPGPHAYLVGGANTWRNEFGRAQSYLAFRMQYDPYGFRERMALFFHNLFATGWTKVNSVALMLNQWDMLHDRALDPFAELLVAVSKDAAMAVWLDSVKNNANASRTPNENYAREVMELYSLGVDNGYNQNDITELAIALGGWSFTIAPGDVVVNPTNPDDRRAARGTFAVYDGSSVPAGHLDWETRDFSSANLPNMRRPTSITFLGKTFDVALPPPGMAKGEDAVRSILQRRPDPTGSEPNPPPNCAVFLATRLLRHFVTTQFSAADVTDVAKMIDVAGFDLRAVLKTLLKSRYFFAQVNRYALVEGPVSWTVRAARALGYALPATAGAVDPSRFPAWALVTQALDSMGMKLLDPNGPNGWKEDANWMNSSTMRFRTRVAAALALGEKNSQDFGDGSKEYTLFPTDPAAWFPAAPTSPSQVFQRLVALLQPATIPGAAVRDVWLAAIFPSDGGGNPVLHGGAAMDDQDRQSARALAFLILCSPSGQLY